MTKVMVVDAHQLVRRALAAMIDAEPDLVCCGDVPVGADAIREIARCRPDVVLIDVSSQQNAGLALLKRARELDPALKIVAMAVYNHHKYIERVRGAGAEALLAKGDVAGRVLAAVRSAIRGKPGAEGGGADGRPRRRQPSPTRAPRQAKLDGVERQIVELIGQGVPGRAIAVRLGISLDMVESYRRRIRDVMKLPSSTEMVEFCVRWSKAHVGSAARP